MDRRPVRSWRREVRPHEERAVDYAPWGLLALAAIVFGGVSILAVPPLGLVGLGVLAYLVYQHLTGTEGPGDDPDRR